MDQNKKLYIGNLAYELTVDELKGLFSEFGEIVDAVIITDRDTGRSKGFGFVEFTNAEDAQKAIKGVDGKEVGGRNLTVNVARPPRER